MSDNKELSNVEITKALTDMSTVLQGLGDEIKGIQEGNEKFTGTLSTITDKMDTLSDNNSNDKDDKDDDSFDDDLNLENLSRKDLLDVMTKRIISAVEKQVVTPLSEKITSVSDSVGRTDLKTEIRELSGKYDDFPKYKDAIISLAENNPSYSIEDLYIVAKQKNPIKDDKDNDSDDKSKDKSPGFGGLTPTSGSSTETKGDLSVDEASEDAWNDSMMVNVEEG